MGIVNIKKEIFIGFLVSLLATSLGFLIFVKSVSSLSFFESLQTIKQGGVLGTALVLGAIPNLLVFFIFLKQKKEYRARGILLGTMLVALIVFTMKFL